MQKSTSNIFQKFFWHILLSIGIIVSANAAVVNDDSEISIFDTPTKEFSTFFSNQDSKDHSPISDLPQDDTSSQENGEEENEENSDNDYDSEFSNTQLEGLADPFLNSFDTTFNTVVAKSYKIPLYILFHCWKDYLV
ncbi:hypothetical protein QYS48_31970 [Marivirga arenosa]|uniref:Uncharacterized protein n=1 Tax=Marivirga arenosa TaxID=3059076 RepID=A0AA51R9X2_9BACT|nr:hypothetical protein [Marivirga sp. ABR2-2]WMN06233.1 hypothetical protein QYS48_31970 [Marivirga sp. ABR2-2]